ncbi:FecCD family ABC transporter permease [Streptomyces hoynatensis]|uniref:Iron ABC transporter permease n=1 Tax=Streptomyces hoynatensis TaxID=1141874 RepID=A0A3A9Z921_9ACTN|nr:iron ABC transporter permease [Streptomyces hoynatensis]RKN43816.1 iron ABC transporter permease [Streptomyces hoynatensis]
MLPRSSPLSLRRSPRRSPGPSAPPSPGPSARRARRPGRPSSRGAALGYGLPAAVLLLGAAALLSVGIGTRALSPGEVWHGLFTPSGTRADEIVRELRLPRTLIGLAAGAALGLAGTLMQALTRNPLADPGILGVNAGAATAVVTGIGLLGLHSPAAYTWLALAGAGAAAILVQALAGGRQATPVRLMLAGTALNAALFAYVNGLQLLDLNTLDGMRFWTLGTLARQDTGHLVQILPFLLAGTLLGAALTGPLNALALGEDTARSLGAHVARTRWLSVAAITLLCGATTALCGPIGFVGLMIPHAVRAFTGPDVRWMVPYSMLLASATLLLSDVAGRLLARPSEIEVGVVTSAVGGVVLIVLVRGRRLSAR